MVLAKDEMVIDGHQCDTGTGVSWDELSRVKTSKRPLIRGPLCLG